MAKQTYGIGRAAIALAKIAPWHGREFLQQLFVRNGRAYVTDGFLFLSAKLPTRAPSQIDDETALGFPSREIAGLDWDSESGVQRPYGLIDIKDASIGKVLDDGAAIVRANGSEIAASTVPGAMNGSGAAWVSPQWLNDWARGLGLFDAEPAAAAVVGISYLGKILDALRDAYGDDSEARMVLRLYADSDMGAIRPLEFVASANTATGETIDGVLMPMMDAKFRMRRPHWHDEVPGDE